VSDNLELKHGGCRLLSSAANVASSQSHIINDVHLVIRTSGERTTAVSRRLAIAAGLVEEDVTTVSEVPFEVALRICYEAAIRAARKWTMTLDADVLLMPSAISELLGFAEQMPPHFFHLEGKVFDKITGIYRQAGHRIYRTELLPLALAEIPDPGAQIRPEYHTITRMVGLGYPSRLVASPVGLHDFEQYYVDLYRKSVVHATKHQELLPELIARGARLAPADPDFLVILKGLWDGLVTADSVTIDARRYDDQAADALQSLGIAEKAPIIDSAGFVRRCPVLFDEIQSAHPVPDFSVWDQVPASSALSAPTESHQHSWFEKARGRMKRRGPIRGGIASLGALLRLAGQRLER